MKYQGASRKIEMRPRNNTKQHEMLPENLVFVRVNTWLFLLLLFAGIASGQTSNPNAALETILKNAEQQTKNYRDAFKNLLADEIKTFEIFNKNGESKKRMAIESNFMIFSSLKDE